MSYISRKNFLSFSSSSLVSVKARRIAERSKEGRFFLTIDGSCKAHPPSQIVNKKSRQISFRHLDGFVAECLTLTVSVIYYSTLQRAICHYVNSPYSS